MNNKKTPSRKNEFFMLFVLVIAIAAAWGPSPAEVASSFGNRPLTRE